MEMNTPATRIIEKNLHHNCRLHMDYELRRRRCTCRPHRNDMLDSSHSYHTHSACELAGWRGFENPFPAPDLLTWSLPHGLT